MEKRADINFTITNEQIGQFKMHLQDIENWKGQAYQQDDEVATVALIKLNLVEIQKK